MNLLCPNCQKPITVPDQYAGQLMKCPLCAHPFPAPALPTVPVAASAPASPVPGSPGTGPASSARGNGLGFATPAPEAPRTAPPSGDSPEPTQPRPPEPGPAPTPTPTGYRRTVTIWISPRVVPWIAPAALVLVVVLSFFPWVVYTQFAPDQTKGTVQSVSAWGLMLWYPLLMLLLAVVALAAVILPRLPSVKLPPAVHQLLPMRGGIVGGVALLVFGFLVFQLLTGFPQETNKEEVLPLLGYRTNWLRLAVLAHLLAVVGAALEFWLTLRKSRPLPRIDLSW